MGNPEWKTMALLNPLDLPQTLSASAVKLVETADHPAVLLSEALASRGRTGPLPLCVSTACGSTQIAKTVNVSEQYTGDVMYKVRGIAKVVILRLTSAQCQICHVVWKPVQRRDAIHQRWFDIVWAIYRKKPDALNYAAVASVTAALLDEVGAHKAASSRVLRDALVCADVSTSFLNEFGAVLSGTTAVNMVTARIFTRAEYS